ncbi:Tachykinin-like peptides receptor 99D [Trichoplax sp. H2]|nr:Tachykinin-like peptides receptor 99D [Trichoplax sp. H2]|eukprot:RDD37254.1 Tachykinin-like peptides receptor 99D [Trichoplax sp. H2]
MNISQYQHNYTSSIYATIYSSASIAALILSTAGLSVNIFLLYILVNDRNFRKTTYYLFLVSIVSDTISTIATIGGYIQIVRYELAYEGGTLMCRAVMFTMFSSYSISIMTFCLIGIDRYFIIVRPLTTTYRIYKNHILITSEIAIWICSLSVSAPLLKFMGVHRVDPLLCEFTKITTPVSIYIITFVTIQFIIPAMTIGLFYWRIIIHQKNYIKPGELTQQSIIEQQLRKRKFIKMLISISLSYIFATWPFFATILGFAITQKSVLQIRSENIVIFLFIFFNISND